MGAEVFIFQLSKDWTFLLAGFADIAGRRLGSIKIPYNKNKSLAGFFTMLVIRFTFFVGYVLISGSKYSEIFLCSLCRYSRKKAGIHKNSLQQEQILSWKLYNACHQIHLFCRVCIDIRK